MKIRNNKTKIKILLVIAIAITLITGLSTTYAFFIYRAEGSNVSLEAGEVKIAFADGKNYFNVENSYPVSDDTGMISPYYSDFTINATTSDVDIKYEIQIVPNSSNTIDTQYIKVYLTDQNDNGVTDIKYYNDLSDASYNEGAKAVYTDYLTESTSKDFRLRIWIDESYDTTTSEDFGFTIYLYAINESAPAYLSDTVIETLSLTEADTDCNQFVYGEVDNNYVWYSGKLWRIVSINCDGSIKLVTQGNMTEIAWDTSSSNTDYSTSQMRRWLNNEFLPTLHNAENLLVDHEWDYTAYADFPTQKATENIMKLEGENAEKVGLLNIYEFMMTGGNASSSNTFLNNGYYWWTMSPKTSGKYIWGVSNRGNTDIAGPDNSYGARPSVNLKSGITILGGTGEKTNPYMIDGDKATGTTSELLSNRISGEYVNFNNTKYRIVGIETINGQQLTKVTMADYDENKKNVLTTSITFGSTTTYSIDEGVGKYLLDWYNATSETDVEGTYIGLYISDTYRKMIATSGDEGDGVYWWIGPGTTRDYTLSKSGPTVATPIGLGYYGEMFSSQFGEGNSSSTNTWLMTKYSGSLVWYVSGTGYASLFSPTYSDGARPSFYLKSNVKINGGSGMPHDPYEISQ